MAMSEARTFPFLLLASDIASDTHTAHVSKVHYCIQPSYELHHTAATAKHLHSLLIITVLAVKGMNSWVSKNHNSDILIIQVSNSDPSWKVSNRSASQKNSRLVYCVNKIPLQGFITSRMNAPHTLTFNFVLIHFNRILLSMHVFWMVSLFHVSQLKFCLHSSQHRNHG
jgi:hypothetical protein